jgi:hypothetical protein
MTFVVQRKGREPTDGIETILDGYNNGMAARG